MSPMADDPTTAADMEAIADFVLAHYASMPPVARMIFEAKRAAAKVGKTFALDHTKLDAAMARGWKTIANGK